MYAIDLFCGAGGMSEGIIQAGFHILFSNDISEDVAKTYINRHKSLGLIQNENTYFHLGDIRNLTGDFVWNCINSLKIFNSGDLQVPTQIDAIFGGPPCQGFSRAGKRDSNDPRNLLFKEYLRVIQQITPRYVVMENVEGFNDTYFEDFSGINGRKYEGKVPAPEILIAEFSMIGYNVLPPKVLDASDFGVPQRRKRAIFIAYRKGEHIPQYPMPTHLNEQKVTVQDALGDLIVDKNIRKKVNPQKTAYQIQSQNGRTKDKQGSPISTSRFFNNELSKHLPQTKERFALFNEGEDGNDLKKRIIEKGINLKKYPHLLSMCCKQLNTDENEVLMKFSKAPVDIELVETLLTKKNMRTKIKRNTPAPTVVTLPDDYISPFENRIFSVRELARLQSFDDSFVFLSKRTTGGPRRKTEVPQYTQVGNAVPPLLSKAIAIQIANAIKGID